MKTLTHTLAIAVLSVLLTSSTPTTATEQTQRQVRSTWIVCDTQAQIFVLWHSLTRYGQQTFNNAFYYYYYRLNARGEPTCVYRINSRVPFATEVFTRTPRHSRRVHYVGTTYGSAGNELFFLADSQPAVIQ